MAKLKPLNDNILIKADKEETENKTESGIILATKTPDKVYGSGTVVELGPGRILNDGTLLPHTVKVGDKVLFYQYAGVTITDNEDTYLIVRENEIIASFD